MRPSVPCPPQPVEVEESDPGNCTFSWESVELADGYQGFIKRNDGVEDVCNTTGNSCHFHCPCGFTYLTSVLAYNLAGDSEPGPVLNYTTSRSPAPGPLRLLPRHTVLLLLLLLLLLGFSMRSHNS